MDNIAGTGLQQSAWHLEQCRFAESAAAFDATGPGGAMSEQFHAHAVFGQRLLRLDLVDVLLADLPEYAALITPSLLRRAEQLTFPNRPDSKARGALTDPGPLFSQLLEAFEVRWRRGDMLHVVSLIHLVGEYVGHLAWASVLGHAVDPARLGTYVDVSQSRWGEVDSPDCGHSRQQRHLARRVRDRSPLRSPQAWGSFLRRDYSRLGEQLLICATRDSMRVWGRRVRSCEVRCPVWTAVPSSEQASLERRVRVALWMRTSPAMDLRHGAPVGHFFGVPDRGEVLVAWGKLRHKLASAEKLVLDGDDLPTQLSSLCSNVSGRSLHASTLIADTAQQMRELLDVASTEPG